MPCTAPVQASAVEYVRVSAQQLQVWRWNSRFFDFSPQNRGVMHLRVLLRAKPGLCSPPGRRLLSTRSLIPCRPFACHRSCAPGLHTYGVNSCCVYICLLHLSFRKHQFFVLPSISSTKVAFATLPCDESTNTNPSALSPPFRNLSQPLITDTTAAVTY